MKLQTEGLRGWLIGAMLFTETDNAFSALKLPMEEHLPPPGTAFGKLDLVTAELVHTIVDNVPTMIAYFDRDLVCRYGNASYRQLMGVNGQSLEGTSFASLVLPDMLEDIMPRARAALRGERQHFEYERPRPGMPSMHLEVKYTPDLRQDQVHGMLVELHDISGHKRIEDLVLETNRDLEERVQERTAKLFESEQRFRLMVDGIQDYCIYFVDEQGHITDWTESAQRMHGLSPHQALRQPLGVLMDASHPGANPHIQSQLLRQAIDRGQSDSDGWQVRDGHTPFWAHTTLTALRNSRGELQGLSAITKDMTALKRLEHVMNDLNQELEKRVEQRTAELHAANRDIDAFSHMVSHDLRAPLRHISGYIAVLREELSEQLPGTSAADMQQHLNAIEKANRSLAGMIEGVLEYARLGRTSITPMQVPLGPVVESEVRKAQRSVAARAIDWQLHTGWPTVKGDAVLLGRLLSCLLDNAVKYTRRQNDARVELGWRICDPDEASSSGLPQGSPRMQLWVRDNGAGFDRERASNLFVMFQRQHHSMDFEGSGTGLALAQRIAQQHGGKIRVESQVDQGCTVTITLPLDPS